MRVLESNHRLECLSIRAQPNCQCNIPRFVNTWPIPESLSREKTGGQGLRQGDFPAPLPHSPPPPPPRNGAVWVSLSLLICLPPKVRQTVHTAHGWPGKTVAPRPWWQRHTCSRGCVNNGPGHELVELHLGLDPRFCSDKSDIGRDCCRKQHSCPPEFAS